MKKHVQAGSALYTDALLSYGGLASEYAHQVIDRGPSISFGFIVCSKILHLFHPIIGQRFHEPFDVA